MSDLGGFISVFGDIIIQSHMTLVTTLIASNLTATDKFAGVGAANTTLRAAYATDSVKQPFGKTVNVSRLYGKFGVISPKGNFVTLYKNGVATGLTFLVAAGLTEFAIALVGGVTYNPTDSWAVGFKTDGGNDNNRDCLVYFDMAEV